VESNVYDTIEPQRQKAMRQTAELAIYHDWQYKRLRYTIISLSGLTPLSLAMGQFTGWPGFTIVAFISSSIATVLLGFQKDFGHKEKAKGYYNDSKQLENVHTEYIGNLGCYRQAKTLKEKDELYYKKVTPLISKWRTQRGMDAPKKSRRGRLK
jgi:hypothetical protein